MLKTGKPNSEGHAFHRRLISQYDTNFTLDNYVAYFDLKPIAKEIECLCIASEKRMEELSAHSMKTQEGGSHTRSPVRGSPKFARPFPVLGFPFTDPTILKYTQKREVLNNKFLEELQKSYRKVKAFLMILEKDIMTSMMELHKRTEVSLCCDEHPDYIPRIYLRLESVLKYRELNLLAFRKILRKFLERCARDSLELQHRIYEIDDVISKSNVSQPSIDLRGISLELIGIYGTVFKYTYEEAVSRLQVYVNRNSTHGPRILPNSETFFISSAFPHHEQAGSFAVRVLAGTGSLFTEKMISEVLRCTRYPTAACGMFANGEISVNLPGKLRGDDVFIVQSLVAQEEMNLSNSASVMELMLMIHAAQLAAASRITAVIPYLAYTRNVASMAVLAEMIESMGCHHLITVDMHSEQVEGMFSIPMESISAKYEFVRYITKLLQDEGHDFANITVVAPSGPALGRAKGFADALMRYGGLDTQSQFVSVCTAVKRQATDTQRATLPTPPAVNCVNLSILQLETLTISDRGRTPLPEGVSVETPTTSEPAPARSLNSPAPSSVADVQMHEVARAASHFKGLQPDTKVEHEARSSSTVGMEVALRKQNEGRQAIITHQPEMTQNEFKDITLVGDVSKRLCIIVDTVIDEAVNICQVAKSLHTHGADRIILVATHAVLSGKYRERLLEAPIDLIITTDSVNQDAVMTDPQLARRLRILPIAPLLARAIEKIHTENALTTLLEK